MIDSKELTKLNAKLNKIGKELESAGKEFSNPVTRELVIGANEIRNTIILSMRNTPQTGRKYRRGKSGGIHIASSPGNPPAIDSGELLRSIVYDVRDMEVEIGNEAGAPYGRFLEEGTKKMEARPWLAPAVEKHKDPIINSVGKIAFEIIGKSFEGIS